MSRTALIPAWLSLLAVAASAGESATRAKPAKPIGVVCGVQGSTAILFIPKADAVKVGEQFAVRRPRLLVAVATPKGQVTRWAEWQDVGRVVVRTLRGPQFALSSVLPPTAAGDRTAAASAIRPGDSIYPSPKSPAR